MLSPHGAPGWSRGAARHAAGGVSPDTSQQLLSQMLQQLCRGPWPHGDARSSCPCPEACPSVEQQFHHLSPSPLAPDSALCPGQVAAVPCPAAAAGTASWRHTGWAKGFIYVQSQPAWHSQHGSGLTRRLVPPTSQLSKGGHASPEPPRSQASRRCVAPAPRSWGLPRSVLGLRRQQSLQEREEICGEVLRGERVGEMGTSRAGLGCRGSGDRGWQSPAARRAPLRDLQEPGPRSVPAGGTPKDTGRVALGRTGPGESTERPTCTRCKGKGTRAPFPIPDHAAATPTPAPHCLRGAPSPPERLCPVPCQPPARAHLCLPQPRGHARTWVAVPASTASGSISPASRMGSLGGSGGVPAPAQ